MSAGKQARSGGRKNRKHGRNRRHEKNARQKTRTQHNKEVAKKREARWLARRKEKASTSPHCRGVKYGWNYEMKLLAKNAGLTITEYKARLARLHSHREVDPSKEASGEQRESPQASA
jgi:hypothetical protein